MNVIKRIREDLLCPPLDGHRILSIRLSDYSTWEAGKCSNGGSYSYHTVYKRDGERFIKLLTTSAEFDYCPVCGVFYTSGHRDCEPARLDAEQVWEEVSEFIEKHRGDSDYSVTVKLVKTGVLNLGEVD